METINIPTEADIKRWVKEAVKECLEEKVSYDVLKTNKEEPLLSRKDIAKLLRISLVTLTDWVKRGLPSHKHRGRVYFLYSEVLHYLKEHPLARFNFKERFEENK